MIKVDLITGFLGSGKTTFLRNYAKHFMDMGQRIGILENDYGAVNVDMMLLNDMRGERCELEMVSGGCDADCHRRRFKTKLIAMAMSGYDRVIIEPSGIFDVDEFFDAVRDEPLEGWYEIGNVITIVDACLEDNLSSATKYYLASQLANSGLIYLSKTDLASETKLENTVGLLKSACTEVNLKKNIDSIIMRGPWSALNASDLSRLENCGYEFCSYVKSLHDDDNPYSSVYFLDLPMSEKKLREAIPTIMGDSSYGHIFRIKGFYKESEKWYQINATGLGIDIAPIEAGQQVLIVIGEQLAEDKIRSVFLDRII